MHKALFLIALITFVLSGSQLSAQVLSTTVFTTEEELYEALREDEISYEQFQILIELISHGIAVSEAYLYDRIPNQLHVDQIDKFDSTALTALQTEQIRAFDKHQAGSFSPDISVSYRYFQKLHETDRHGYRFRTKLKLNNQWSTAAQFSRTVTGRDRVVSRSVSYNNDIGLIKKMTLGSFNTRLGLGTIYGYRGKIFDLSNRLDLESLSYPDYGGFNGLQLVMVKGETSTELIALANRDLEHSLQSVGGIFSVNNQRLTPALIVGFSRLKNRLSGEIVNDLKLGLFLQEHHEDGQVSIEITKQLNSNRPSSAFVLEGSQQFMGAKIKYAGWSYDDKFLNLTSGSKGASLSHTVAEKQTGFLFSDRLAGQRGGLLKSILQLSNDWELTSSVIIGDRRHDRSIVEMLSSLRRIWSKRLSLRADFSSRRRQLEGGSADINRVRRSRLELRFNLGELSTRTYIAYSTRDQEAGFWSLFSRVRLPVRNIGTVELSSNIGRIVSGQIEYWFIYLKHDQELSSRMKMTIKLSNSYSLTRTVRHDPMMTFELTAAI